MTTAFTFSDKLDELHTAASQATGGLIDFGDQQEYLPGLTQLVQAIDNNSPKFKEGGVEFVYGMLVGTLISRLLTEQGLKDHPQCLQQTIKRPLVIIGIPRTGTTALHKLLSVDPQFQGLDRWLTAFPMPRPPREAWNSNPWYQACVQGLEDLFSRAPEMRAAHDIRADDVDECLEVLKQNFCSNYFSSILPVPSYDQWWQSQSEAASYRRYHQILQLIGCNDPEKPWLLKNPGHLATVDLLLDTFPDACVVQTHRNPVKALPSLCSVLQQGQGILEGDEVDLVAIGRRELAYWSEAAKDGHRARQRAPQQFMDVLQSDLHRDPMAVVRGIYNHFGYTLTSEVEAMMLERVERNPEGSHGEHHYTAETFGLSESEITQSFRDYLDYYIQ